MAKLLVDADGITLAEANERLSRLRLEIIADDANTASAQNAILTSVSVGRKTFVGGVRVHLNRDQTLISSLPIGGATLREAIEILGAENFEGNAAATVVIGQSDEQYRSATFAWWDGWKAGASDHHRECGRSDNPLSGIAAGAAAVARSFGRLQLQELPETTDIDLWPAHMPSTAPEFPDTYFPKAVWMLGMGNLGQACLWSLSALPYSTPADVLLVLQDRDRIKPENWGTSILVTADDYESYKTAIGERWGRRRGFDVRRFDRWLDSHQRVADGEPALALCGFDKIEARLLLDTAEFDAIVDSGLGREAGNFDRFRTTVLDPEYGASHHFDGWKPAAPKRRRDYEKLVQTDSCGAAIFEGIAIAAPYVSAVAGAVAVTRLVGICSGLPVPRTETRSLRDSASRGAGWIKIRSRRILRAR